MNKKRDILFLCQYFYPEYVSSATLPYDTAKALASDGFTVSALCGYPIEYSRTKEVPMNEVKDDIQIKRLKYFQLKRSNFVGRMINYFSFTFVVFIRIFYLRKFKSVIVYSNPPVLPLITAWASKLFGIKMVFVSYDVYPEMAHITNSISESGMISKLMNYINKRIYSNVDRVVALSSEMKTYLLKHRELLTEEQVSVIPNWYEEKTNESTDDSYDNDKFKVLEPKENLIVSYFGNMGICQDLDTILNSIRQLKNEHSIKFLFAGHGNKMQKLKDSIKAENLKNVVVFDFLHGQDFQDALEISDCFLVSLTDGLTGLAVPSKTYSYMMAGKPVIAIMGKESDISKDLIENQAGYSIDVGESQKVRKAIKELLANEKLRFSMGENILKVYQEKYTTSKCTKQYIEMMHKVLEV